MNSGLKVPDIERRKYPRFSAALPIEYGQIDTSKSNPGHTVNISEGGLMVALSEKIGVGEKLRLKISFTIGPRLHSISTTGKVVWWMPKREETGYYRYGLEFEDIPSQDLEKLRSFLTNFGDG
jgi:c-di-GMP-binding flagellar brake protein YcgR